MFQKIKKCLFLVFVFLIQCACTQKDIVKEQIDTYSISASDTYTKIIESPVSSDAEFNAGARINEPDASFSFAPEISEKNLFVQNNNFLTVHYIDVGQGNAVLVESSGRFMMIDGGETDKAANVQSYLHDIGVKEIDYVIATHPHSDHIGGLPPIIRNFNVKKILMPDVQNQTLIFEDLLFAIQDTDLGITIPLPGDSYTLGTSEFTVFAPIREYGENLNNASIGLRIDFGQTSFLFAGDAESAAEEDMISGAVELKADVFLANHHGSDTSNSEAFLQAVSPRYTVISVGSENAYGHPSASVLQRLQSLEIPVYRTDEYGTIIAYSDGIEVSWNLIPKDQRSEIILPADIEETQIEVFITDTGEKYHRKDCRFLKSSAIPIMLDEAKLKEYSACGSCKPPE